MTVIEERFLEIFKERKIARNSLVMPQVITIALEKWTEQDRDAAGEADNQLAEMGYVTNENNKYKLLDKGFDYIYRHYNLDQTKQIILDIFKLANLEVGHLLPNGTIMVTRTKLDGYHQENFMIALEALLQDNLITQDVRGFKLTEDGFNRIRE